MLIIEQEILVLGKGLAQGLDDTTIIAEAKYSINLTESVKKKKALFKSALQSN